MATIFSENSEENNNEFLCKKCDYICYKKQHFKQHLLTNKHKNNEINNVENKIVSKNYDCECGKKYKDRTGLWKHKKTCDFVKQTDLHIIDNDNNDNNDNSDISFLTNLVLEVVKNNSEIQKQNSELQKQNNELQKQMLEVIKNGTNNTVNSHNKTFNLQVFLNETCKDAMNIMDFVDSIKIQLSDIESIGELGYVNGMSKLIIKHLNALEENMRPVHCSDPKRESLYVKDANVWEKEDPDNKKIKKAIKYISHKNICALPEWKAKYPDCIYSDSKKSDQYNHIVVEAMGGSGDNDAEKANKIVKKIAKVVTIDKNI
jgi:hypothetical protein